MKKFLLCIALVAIVASVPVAGAAGNSGDNGINQTNASEPYYITIVPVGNHTVGDVFFINGTTNLPVGEKLSIGVFNDEDRSPFYGFYISNIAIIPSSQTNNGINMWSVNVTDQVKEKLINGGYLADVFSSKDYVSNGTDVFYLLPANTVTPSTVSSTKPPLPTTTQSSPLLTALPIAIIAAIIIMISLHRKK